ncbi:MAG: benzoate-CoA ligase family protein [Candidatus Binataceae bacterium]|nr:benzoate-CoA ligase family protein [Candidatus Binataceae bacterium]
MTPINASEELLKPALERGFDQRPALIVDGQTISYAALASMANRAGHAMRSLGVTHENRVLMILDDSAELVAAYLGTIRIGAVAIAFNTRCSAADLEFAIVDSRAQVLIIGAAMAPMYRTVAPRLRARPHVVVVGGADAGAVNFDDLIARQSNQLDPEPMSPDDMAFWIYTSGTTGTPKAAVHAHHDVLSAGPYLAECLGVRAGDRLFSTSRLFFAYALGNCLFGSMRLCATTILHPQWPDAESVARIVEETAPDIVFSVPTMYRNLIRTEHASQPGFAKVRAYASAGERLPPGLAEKWEQTTGVRIFEGMGSSETIYMVFSNSPLAYRPGSSGKLAPGAEAMILDDQNNRITEPGRVGALRIRIGSTCDRYWNRREITRKAFFGSWLSTGDLYSFDEDGFWYQHGRADETFKVSGQWVSPIEIEDCIAGLPQILDAAAVGIAGREGLTEVMLAIVTHAPASDRDRLAAELRDLLRKKLAGYKCPREIRFVDQIPRTATGKVQRYKLREQLSSGVNAGDQRS